MERRIRWLALGILGVVAIACGGGGGGGGGGTGVVLEYVHVDPDAATVDLYEAVMLTCLAHYSDGTDQPVTATWTNSSPAIVSIDATSGASVAATALDLGTAQITASSDGLTAHAYVTVTDAIPADPGTVYGIDYMSGTAYAYPPAGGGAPTALYTGLTSPTGFVADRRGTTLYMLTAASSGYELTALDVATGTPSAPLAMPTGFPLTLDTDSAGRLFTSDYGDGTVLRIDPATGDVMVVGHNGGGMLDLAVGRDDAPYYCPIITGVGSPWIGRHDLSTDTGSIWALVPPMTGAFGTGIVIPCGLAMNRRGEAFIAEAVDTDLYMHKDLNGDGDALDFGETVKYGPMHTGPKDVYMTFGVSTAKGGTVLLNVQPFGGASAMGVYWLADKDGSGDAYGPGEAALYNATYMDNGIDAGNITAGR